ncbi:hypothetical protein BC938DRAFT_483938 [Jimgerdemannia flammicorona]|uniref:Uncharacterized protein n=1 Tax=Jimgerdemannia flammicorona TaxID=994334 RepID=A0A433QAW8_9FUNG|nr:hypothetical protein BC938DRAFT_483938 [Jimgerdemannia flammicorona]
MYQLMVLREMAEMKIVADLTPENVLKHLFEYGFNYPNLRSKFVEFMVDNFEHVRLTTEFPKQCNSAQDGVWMDIAMAMYRRIAPPDISEEEEQDEYVRDFLESRVE